MTGIKVDGRLLEILRQSLLERYDIDIPPSIQTKEELMAFVEAQEEMPREVLQRMHMIVGFDLGRAPAARFGQLQKASSDELPADVTDLLAAYARKRGIAIEWGNAMRIIRSLVVGTAKRYGLRVGDADDPRETEEILWSLRRLGKIVTGAARDMAELKVILQGVGDSRYMPRQQISLPTALEPVIPESVISAPVAGERVVLEELALGDDVGVVDGAVAEGDDAPERMGEADGQPQRSSSVPLRFVLRRLDWGVGSSQGSMDAARDPIVMEPYGWTIVGGERSVRIDSLHAGDTMLLFQEGRRGMSIIARFPSVEAERMPEVAERIMHSNARLFHGGEARKESEELLLRMRERGATPYEYEMRSIADLLDRNALSASEYRGALLFVAGVPVGEGFGVPPAPVVQIVSALKASGFSFHRMRMVGPLSVLDQPLVIDTATGVARVEGRELIRLSGAAPAAAASSDRLMLLWRTLHREMLLAARERQLQRQIFAQYLLPVFAGLYGETPQEIHVQAQRLREAVRGINDLAMLRVLRRAYVDLCEKVEGDDDGGDDGGGTQRAAWGTCGSAPSGQQSFHASGMALCAPQHLNRTASHGDLAAILGGAMIANVRAQPSPLMNLTLLTTLSGSLVRRG